MPIGFDVISAVTGIRVIAKNNSIRELDRLKATYGNGNWRKLAGIATIRLADGTVYNAEIHWYEAHGTGKVETKIKRIMG